MGVALDAEGFMEHGLIVGNVVQGVILDDSGGNVAGVCAGSYLTKDSIRLIFQPSG